MDLREIVEDVDWIYLAQDMGQWQTTVNTIKNLQIS
jgi:hypothetical protein